MRMVMMLGTFAALAAAWWELSGGETFEPGTVGVTLFAPVDPQAQAGSRLAALDADDDRRSVAERAAAEAPVLTARPAAPSPARTAAAIDPVSRAQTAAASAPVQDDAIAATLAAVLAEPQAFRTVSGNRVALRAGPGPDYGVVTELLAGETVAVLRDEGAGWVKLRAVDGDATGWVAERFLIASN